jgi:hypothetical protein
MFAKLAAIARNTFVETVRQPIFSVLTWVGMGMLILNPALSAFSLESGSDIKILYDVGLATLLLYGLFTAVFSATSVITREIESFTVLTVVSKPVSRPLFLCGKFLGVAGAVLVGYYLLSLTLFMTARHGVMETVSDKFDRPVILFSLLAILISLTAATFGNYVYGWHFLSTMLAWLTPLGTLAMGLVLIINKKWELQSPGHDFGNLQLLFSVLTIYFAVLILTALAVALATRFSQVVTLLLCAGAYVLGLLSDYLFGRHVDQGVIYQALYTLVPNFQFFWFGDALTQERIIPLAQVGRVAGYAGIYTLAVLGLGVALFETREVG